MSKLCKCSKSFIRSLFMSTIRDAYESADSGYMWPLDELNYSTEKVDEVSRVLESDCVCEKKEDRNLDCPNKCTVDEAGNSRFKFCSECGKKIEWDKIREELNLKKNE